MKFNELFTNDFFLLPKLNNSNEYFDNLSDVLKDYLSLVSKISDIKNVKNFRKDSNIKNVISLQEKFINGILNSLELYFNGKPSDAYQKLSQTLESRIKYNKRMIRIGSYIENEKFYRMRVKADHYPFKSEEMFHIPFELRRKVTTQRYSIPGFPSLYLGRTIHVCWEEMLRPDLNTFQVSKLTSKKEIKFLDLTPPNKDEDIYNLVHYGYIMMWPLIAACSFKVEHRKDQFKPEYIIPQLLLQWVRNEKMVDGIKYNSTHIKKEKITTNDEDGNIVIPVKTNSKNGLCKDLLSYFEISNPISWHFMQMANGGLGSYLYNSGEFDYIDKKLPNFKSNNSNLLYSNSVLGAMEYYLDGKPYQSSSKWSLYMEP